MTQEHADFREWKHRNCRLHPSEVDLKFITHILSGEGLGSEELKHAEIDPSVRDELLDHEGLVNAILDHPGNLPISLELYFYTIVRHSLLGHELDDRLVADYIVWILLQRVRSGAAFNNEVNEGKTFFYVIDYLNKIGQANEEEAFYLRTNLGNQTLFMTGLFEGHIRSRTERRGAPKLEYFESIGQEQYKIVKDHPLSIRYELTEVFEVLGDSFSTTRKVLNGLSERLVSLGDPFKNY